LPGAEHYFADPNHFRYTDALLGEGFGANINGEPYPQSVVVYVYNKGDRGYVTYVLGRNYRQLRAVVGIDDVSNSAVRARIKITVDNRVAFDRTMGKGEAVPLNLDVNGTYQITFSATHVGSGVGTVAFGDARVTLI
jgi:hypothetical protein